MNTTNDIKLSEWSRAKPLRALGYTPPQLMRFAAAGLIRTSHIRLPGQSRGIKLYHVGDLEQLVAAGIENANPERVSSPRDQAGPTQ